MVVGLILQYSLVFAFLLLSPPLHPPPHLSSNCEPDPVALPAHSLPFYSSFFLLTISSVLPHALSLAVCHGCQMPEAWVTSLDFQCDKLRHLHHL